MIPASFFLRSCTPPPPGDRAHFVSAYFMHNVSITMAVAVVWAVSVACDTMDPDDTEGAHVSTQSWTPALRKGIVPLHPLSFGVLIGKPFAVLRHNPKVLFGFAIVVQLLVALVTAGVMGLVLFTTFVRLESVSTGSEDFLPILWGSLALNGLVALAMGFVGLAFTAVVQGVVAADVASAVLAEKPSLRSLWRRMRPALWRLMAWSLVQSLAVVLVIALVAGIIAAAVTTGLGGSGEGVALIVVVGVLLVLGMIPLWVWLGTKLLLVPSILTLEHVSLREALVRSWRLTRGRFWVAFGVVFLVNAIMGVAMNVVSLPLILLSTLLGSVIAPTGPNDASSVAGYLLATLGPQLLVFVLQAITVVVQCAAAAFIYLDCRMRYEGLDQTLVRYLEDKDLGVDDERLGDPFALDRARAVTAQHPTAPGAAGAPFPAGAQGAWAAPFPAGAQGAWAASPTSPSGPRMPAPPPPPAPRPAPVPEASGVSDASGDGRGPDAPTPGGPWVPPGRGPA